MNPIDPTESPSSAARRRGVFAIVVVMCAVGAAAYAWHAIQRSRAAEVAQGPIRSAQIGELPGAAPSAPEHSASMPSATPSMGTTPSPEMGAGPATLTAGSAATKPRPFLLFRSTALGDSYGRVSLAYLDALGGERLVSPLQCERVHYAAGTGLCLEAQRGALTTYQAHLFDRNFRITRSFPLAGPPSRARVSPDGKYAAMTVFVTGHSYGGTSFTTRTSIIDVAGGRMLAEDLEAFEVARAGEIIKAADFNFWGVTFARDGKRFYATLGTAGKTLLVEGDLAARRMQVLRDDVECPSLSPDNQRIAFKRRHAGSAAAPVTWGVVVLDLASGRETALLAETRNVDDQVEWLDNGTLLYGMPKEASASTDIWAAAADGGSKPRLYLPLAYSPAIVTRP